MFAKTLLLAAAATTVAATVNLTGSTDRVLRIKAAGVTEQSTIDKAQQILGQVDVWGESADGSLELRVAEELAHVFSDVLGFDVVDSTEEHLENERWMEENRASQVCDDESCAQGDDFYNMYQSLENIHGRFDELISTYSTVESMSWGTSGQGRDMRGARITSAEGGDNKPVVFYFCGEHAREWIPPMFCTYMAENLASRYAAGEPAVVSLMDRVEFNILPVMNPDGYVFSRTPGNNQWRKSRKENPGSSCVGTDLNRNYAFQWNTGGSSSNPCSDTFHGQRPFDNEETSNLARYAEGLGDRMIVQTDVHAYGQMWMHPWGWTRSLSADDADMQRCGDATRDAIRSVNGLTFRTGTISNVIYVASGSSCDWFYGERGVKYSYAPEVRGTSFQPPASNIAPSNAELWAGMIAGVECALANP